MKHKIALCSLLFALCSLQAQAATRINRADAYREMNAKLAAAQYQEEQAAVTATAASLPVRVANKELEAQILGGKTTDVDRARLESCAGVYPNGKFAWDKPTAGMKLNSPATCVAVVEMRKFVDGTNDIVVATANVAAGDVVNCNIGEFPEATYTIDAANVVFPADRAPTVDDVISVMNDEQKKNAGFKIAAGLVVGGLVGNAASKNELGKTSFIGGKQSAGGTVAGALSGAAVMAGSSYAGKVGGDVILSSGVNAAAGGAIGNMVASGDSVLHIEECTDLTGVKTKCLWGVIEKNKPLDPTKNIGFYNISNGKTMVCDKDSKACAERRLIGISFGNGKDDYKSSEAGLSDQNFLKIRSNPAVQYAYNSETRSMTGPGGGNSEGIWAKLETAGEPTQTIAAMIPGVVGLDKAFGSKMSDWYKWRTANPRATVVARNNKGEASALPKPATTKDENGTVKKTEPEFTINDFYPLTVDASDGGIIDVSNKARLKGTLIGAGAGAGIGAFTAYQGATEEIDARWVASVTEYKDSLQKVYCATGTRFLSQYNDLVIIPSMQ